MPTLPPMMFPVKGVNRTFPRSAQSDGTCYDMQNVLPFDRTGRLRGGQRPGTVKQVADALASKIVLLGQVATTHTVTGGGTGGSSGSFTDDFNYPSGGGLGTKSGGVWISADPTTLQTTGTVIESVGDGSAPGVSNGANLNTPAIPIDVTGQVNLSCKFKFPSTVYNAGTTPDGWSVSIGLLSQASETASVELTGSVNSGGHLAMNFFLNPPSGKEDFGTSLDTVFFDGTAGGTPGTDTDFPYLAFDTWYTLKLVISSDGLTLSGLIDGVQYLTVNLTSAMTVTQLFGVTLVMSNTNSTVSGSFADLVSVTSDKVIASGNERLNNLIAVAGGDIYVGDLTAMPGATAGANTLDATAVPQMAFTLGKAYFVDGTSIVQMDVKTKTVETYTATAGTAPTGCTLACVYRDRLVLARPNDNPQDFFCSRVGDQHDWDYGQSDPAAAFAGNASISGRVGEPITALIPASDDLLYIGGDHNLWVIRGDPADGGSIDMVSDAVGVLGPDAWTKAPDGTIYFLGTGGFYRLAGNNPPEELSKATWTQFFSNIDRTTNRITMAWDRDRHGCFIFIMPNTGTPAATVLWYDARTEGFFPQLFPSSHGPFSAAVFDGDGPDDRVLLLGGTDGYLRATSGTATTDDGTAIDSYVIMGPYPIGDPIHDGVIEAVDVTYGEPATGLTSADWGVVLEVRGGKDAYSVTEGTARHVFTRDFGSLSGKVPTTRRRVRGAWCAVKVGNTVSGKHWSLESVVLTAIPGGRTRR